MHIYTKNLIRFCFFSLTALIVSCSGSGENANKNADPAILELPAPTPLPQGETNFLKQASEDWYNKALLRTGFNGGIIVAKKGNIIFERYNGTAHIPGTDSINANTPMHIASVSKTFTAMAVLKLWQDKKLNIDDELSKYIPEFNVPGVTIRSLLNHRSGLPNYVHYFESKEMNWNPAKYVTNQDVLNSIIQKPAGVPPFQTPNTHFEYCNTNYALLALLIEKVSGKKYADYLHQVFFHPLQMNHTFVYNIADSTKFAPSYDWRGGLIPLNALDAVYGDKNIYTTPQDLLQWDRALYSGLLFTPATLEAAFSPYSNERPGVKNYGLGWRMNLYPNNKKIIFHNGWWHGSNASFLRLIQDSATIIIIGNKFNRNIYHSKDLANAFSSYFKPGSYEEETEKGNDASPSSNEDAENSNEGNISARDSILKEMLKGNR